MPRRHKATVVKRDEARLRLRRRRIRVDPELVTVKGAILIEALSLDITTVLVIPGNDQIPIRKLNH